MKQSLTTTTNAARDAGQNTTHEYRYGWLGNNDLRVRIDVDGEIEARERGFIDDEQVGRGDILSTPGAHTVERKSRRSRIAPPAESATVSI